MKRPIGRAFEATRSASLGASLVIGLALASGCSKSEASTSRQAQPVGAPAGSAAPGARFETEAYTLELRAPGPYKAGVEGAAEIVLVAKEGYHVNDQFPHKFTPREGVAGVTFKGPVGREGGTVEPKRALLKVPFTAAAAGPAKVAGKFSFSVCSDKNCLLEKQELEAVADVK